MTCHCAARNDTDHRMRVTLLLAGFAAAIVLAFVLYPGGYPQDVRYHRFADTRSWLGIPNAFDVVSNVGFLAVFIAWVISASGAPHPALRATLSPQAGRGPFHPAPRGATRDLSEVTFFVGVFLTSIGSAYYHWNPNNATLPWDRLGMSIAFMALLAILVEQRITQRAPLVWLVALELFGIVSVIDSGVFDDLRLYGVTQFFPMLMIAVLIEGWLWAAGAAYVIAKGCEALDHQIFRALHETVSGHTLKHLFAALGIYFIWRWLRSRRPAFAGRRAATT